MELLFLFVMFIIFGIGAGMYKFIKWALSPLIEHLFKKDEYSSKIEYGEEIVIDEKETPDKTSEPLKVEITSPHENLEKYNFFIDRKEDKLDTEPKFWKEYIGQEATKDTIKETLQAIKNDKTIPYPHILISGNAGYGKSALIHLLARQSNLHLIETIAGNLEKPDDIYKLFAQLKKEPPYSIIFIDEIHGLKKEVGELLLPAVQLFKVANKPIPYFTLAGATTDLGLLTKKLSPLVDRCKQQFILRAYSNEELATIINNQAKKRDLEFTPDALIEIASRSKQTPRLALGLLDNIYYYAKYKNITKIDKEIAIQKMENLKIHKGGITEKDIKLLTYLSKQNTPVGANTLTQVLNTDNLTYQYFIEPFLVRKEFIVRTPRGRVISSQGKDLLKGLSNENKTNL